MEKDSGRSAARSNEQRFRWRSKPRKDGHGIEHQRQETIAARDDQQRSCRRHDPFGAKPTLQSPTTSINQIALQRRVCRHRFRRLIKLSWLAPDIVTAIVEGRHPASFTAKQLLAANLPIDWVGQKRLLGFV